MDRSSMAIGRIGIYALLLAFAAVYLMPLYVMVMTSLKDIEEIRQGNLLSLPESPTFYAWVKAWGSACTGSECQGLAPFFFNSIRIVVPAVLISTLIGALNV